MDHKTFLTTLPAELTNQLTVKLNLLPLCHLAAHIGLILLTGSLIALKIPFWPALLPIHGIFLIFLFTLEHEATHKTPFASERLNEAVGRLIGLIIVLPFQWFRYFHLAHHKHTNIPDKDPELLAGSKPDSWPDYILYVSGLPYWRAMIIRIIQNARGQAQDSYLPKSTLPRIRSEARWMLITYAIGAASLAFSSILIWVWIVPLLLGQPFLRLFLLAEHGRCAFVSNMFENTRTTYTAGLIRFLSWNMSYHSEHHTMPNVPFHNLPELHRYTQDHLRVTSDGYHRFNRLYTRDFSSLTSPKIDGT